MKILQACALISVCLIAAAALALVAAGYSLQLEAPQSIAASLGAGVVAAVPSEQVPHYVLLMEDGTIHRVYVSSAWGEIEIVPEDIDNGGQWPRPPVPTSEIVWWNLDRFITAEGLFYAWGFNDSQWHSVALPSLAVSASSGVTSGMKARYGTSSDN